MSVLYSSDQGWIISHLDYLHKIYKNVEHNGDAITLKFNDNFFGINSQYLRQNQINSYKESLPDSVDCSTKRIRKRKHVKKLPENILKLNNFVERISKKILQDSEHLKLFNCSSSDNNERSRLESKNFYIERLDTTSNYYGSNEKYNTIIAEFNGECYVFPSNCKFYCYDVREMNNKLDFQEKYDFILLDPPWWNKSIKRKKEKFEESSYKMLYNEELSKIPIAKLLSSSGIVAVWCTNSSSHLKSIEEEIFPSWGVTLKAKWFWLKVTQAGKPICNFDESHGKQPYEQIVFGMTSSNTSINFPEEKIIISVPSAVHSHKPPIIEILESHLPANPRCMEIFARYLLPGFTSWGLEVLKFQHLSLYSSAKSEKILEKADEE